MWLAAAISFVSLFGLRFVRKIEVGPELQDRAAPQTIASAGHADSGGPLLPFVYQVGVYGFLLGCVGGGIGRFIPLFAEEVVGLTTAVAGVVFGLAGLIAVGARVASGILLDRGLSVRTTLTFTGLGGAVALVLMVLSGPGPALLLWVGTILSGLTLSTWNTAANLSMVRQGVNAGRASGVLVMGFMIGLTVSGPAVGRSIDQLDSYTPAFVGSVLLAVVGVVAVVPRLSPEAPTNEA